MGFKQKCRCNWKSPSQEPHSKFSVTNQRTKIFGKTLQTLARDSNRPLSLRHGRLNYIIIRGPFENFVDWRQYAAVMQREAVTVMPSYSDGGNVVAV
jgi:hypothetical protein